MRRVNPPPDPLKASAAGPTTEAPPILLTGLPRCGSSWVGQRLSTVDGIRYRYESLNKDWVPALRGKLAPFRYQRPGTPGPEHIRQAANRAMAGRQSNRQRLRGIYRGYGDAVFRRQGRLVLKDPTACLLAGWLSQRHGCRVIVLTRHPCGFVHSVRRLGWPMRLQRLLTQRPLVRDHLQPHLPVLEACLDDPLAALGGLWAATHHVLCRQAAEDEPTPSEAGSNWHFLPYERLCLAPEAGFAELSDAVGAPVSPAIDDGKHQEDPGSTVKDSRRVALAWKAGLTRDEKRRVMTPVDALGLRTLAEAGFEPAPP